MRKLGDLDNHEDAKCFRWYLESQSIEAWHDEEDSLSVTVWLVQDSQKEQAMALLQEFKEDPKDPSFKTSSEQAAKKHHVKSVQEAKERKRALSANRDSFISNYPVTFCLIAACTVIFLNHHYIDKQHTLFQYLCFSADPIARLTGVRNFSEILSGQIWRLVTPALMHADWFHIIFNMLWFYQFARQIEGHMSSKRLLSIMLVISISSHVVFYLVAGPMFLGMSGVNYGLLAYIWTMERFSSAHRNLDGQASKFFVFWYCLCLVLTLIGMPVANTIHGVGGLAGLVLGIFHSGRNKNLVMYFRYDEDAMKYSLWGLGLLVAGMIIDHYTY
ncbi:MAG: rhomboid family intramembrane serine protease [Oligoflexales bacterium]|nr:rhomboid family intramembrane serine protease [Oligoflexales bacterium]